MERDYIADSEAAILVIPDSRTAMRDSKITTHQDGLRFVLFNAFTSARTASR
jgi:hypothetical protein